MCNISVVQILGQTTGLVPLSTGLPLLLSVFIMFYNNDTAIIVIIIIIMTFCDTNRHQGILFSDIYLSGLFCNMCLNGFISRSWNIASFSICLYCSLLMFGVKAAPVM